MKANPTCPRSDPECRVSMRTYVQPPVLTWTPIYDGTGRMVNADPNTHVVEYACATCGETWNN